MYSEAILLPPEDNDRKSDGMENLRREAPCGEEAASIEADLQRAMSNLRVVMDNLHPQTLDILGLPAAIESLLEKSCESTGSPAYHFLATNDAVDLKLPRLTQVTLYRIVVEVIHNGKDTSLNASNLA